jgi:hypothetical protein
MSAEERRAELAQQGFPPAVIDRIMKRGKLAIELGTLKPSQAHHIIPVEVWGESEAMKIIIEDGWDPNAAANGIALSQGFHGSHPAYTSYVKRMLSRQFANKKNLTIPQITVEIQKAIDGLRSLIADAKVASKQTKQSLNDYFAKL